MVASGSGKWRKRSQDTPPDRTAKRQKAPETQGPSYVPVSDSALTRVVVASGYLDVCLTPLELDDLRAQISKGIYALLREGQARRFDETYLRTGAIVVRAADLWSLEWLVRMAEFGEVSGSAMQKVHHNFLAM